MTESFSPDRPRQLLADLCALVRERASGEEEIAARFASDKEAAERQFQEGQKALADRYHAEKTAAETGYTTGREATAAKFQADYDAAEQEYESLRAKALARFESGREAAQQELQEARWEATAMSEAACGGSNLQVKEILAGLDARWQELQAIHQQAVEMLQQRGQWRDVPQAQPTNLLLENQPAHRFCHALDVARAQSYKLSRQILPQFFQGLRPLGIVFVVLAATVALAGSALGWQNWPWAAVIGVAVSAALVLVGSAFYRVAGRQSAEGYLALRQTLLEAGLDRPAVLEAAKAQCRRLYAGIATRQTSELKRIEEHFAAVAAELQRRKEHDLQKAEETYPPRLKELAAGRDRALQEIEEKHPRLQRRLDEDYAAASQQLRASHAAAVRENEERFQRAWAEMAECWRTGIQAFHARLEQVAGACGRSFPDWNTADWDRWTMPADTPPAIPFGQGEVKLAQIAGGLPADDRLRPAQTEFTLPLLLPFPQNSLVLLKANGPGRKKAVDAMQAIMLRMLTAIPPGKIRFTVIDPVGLGEDFSTFMHLADYDEQLIASRIWTETAHIEQRLADLTKHMEDVIQVYLRKEFLSIGDYNAYAGEMAEPYRVLVVANFPANFSEAAAHRIKSIVSSGARCGVFVLLSVDTNMPMPHHFNLPDLEPDALVLRWDDSDFVWEHPDYGPLPVRLEGPPPADRFREIVCKMGEEAKHSGRVEVPFACSVPAVDQWWTVESSAGINVPLGRAGAMKFQHLDLGSGTSQHVLISGKTGSGKSTLLHVLITNLAIRYSPDEVELYLVDFKKGVEFKAYARFELPHARVVAIESEREFGLSVLQRLDAELRTRGDLFRKLGVQDLKSYRAVQRGARLPRVLLIVDEFQELFVEDDRIAQESALLLDRLVRQGRAFGIHVLLGSQTLGGAYSLARSTIGQMAVRIALQCSEGDAHLILSEDNTAARLLTRPGEAIYNDANGLYEGNHPFQVVWLPDDVRDDYLERIRHLAAERHRPRDPLIVFEGNVLADLGDNPTLRELLTAPSWPESCPTPEAWLGSAVAIKEATSAVFIRQNGSNLLLVGHREEGALGVLASGLISLAAQHPPGDGNSGAGGARFYILDGTRPDAPEVGFWNRLAAVVPHRSKVVGPRGLPEIMAELAEELARRHQEGHDFGPPVYLVIYGLGRFRELRKEDDFGYAGLDDGQPPSPAKQFRSILRDGPAVGIHTLVWCDTYANLTRMLDRQGLQDFEMRVLFQMNATDSSSLMDAPDAARLGVHRAMFSDEGQGRAEKFRPYGPPPNDWLAWVRKGLHGRAASPVA